MQCTILRPDVIQSGDYNYTIPRFPGYINDMYLLSGPFKSIDVILENRSVYSISYEYFRRFNEVQGHYGNRIPLIPACKTANPHAPAFSHLCYTELKLRVVEAQNPEPIIIVIWA